jgi:hypothetical protein
LTSVPSTRASRAPASISRRPNRRTGPDCATGRPLRRRIDLMRATSSRGENGLQIYLNTQNIAMLQRLSNV